MQDSKHLFSFLSLFIFLSVLLSCTSKVNRGAAAKAPEATNITSGSPATDAAATVVEGAYQLLTTLMTSLDDQVTAQTGLKALNAALDQQESIAINEILKGSTITGTTSTITAVNGLWIVVLIGNTVAVLPDDSSDFAKLAATTKTTQLTTYLSGKGVDLTVFVPDAHPDYLNPPIIKDSEMDLIGMPVQITLGGGVVSQVPKSSKLDSFMLPFIRFCSLLESNAQAESLSAGIPSTVPTISPGTLVAGIATPAKSQCDSGGRAANGGACNGSASCSWTYSGHCDCCNTGTFQCNITANVCYGTCVWGKDICNGTCYNNCAAGTARDYSTCGCKCLNGGQISSGCSCLPTQVLRNGVCVDCPSPSSVFGNMCCPQNTHGTAKGCACNKSDGFVYTGGSCKKCPGNSAPNSGDTACVCPVSGQTWDASAAQCVCPIGQKATSNGCVPEDPCKPNPCTGSQNICVPNFVADPPSYICQCPANQIFSGGKCVDQCNSTNCPTGKCVNNACVDPCAGVSCQAGESCVDVGGTGTCLQKLLCTPNPCDTGNGGCDSASSCSCDPYKGVQCGPSPTPTPSTTPSPLPSPISVICTELHRQGVLPDGIYEADTLYGKLRIDSETMKSYHSWGEPLAKLMKTSPSLTQIVKPFASAWAYEMAYEMGAYDKPNVLGKFLLKFGVPTSNFIGKIIRNFYDKKQKVSVSTHWQDNPEFSNVKFAEEN